MPIALTISEVAPAPEAGQPAFAGLTDAIIAIYNDAVVNTTAIWNDTCIDVANRLALAR